MKPDFLATQTQMCYFGDIGVLTTCIHGVGLNPWEQAERKGWDFSISKELFLCHPPHSFLLCLAKILCLFSKMGGERVETFRRSHRYKCHYALLIWVCLRWETLKTFNLRMFLWVKLIKSTMWIFTNKKHWESLNRYKKPGCLIMSCVFFHF